MFQTKLRKKKSDFFRPYFINCETSVGENYSIQILRILNLIEIVKVTNFQSDILKSILNMFIFTEFKSKTDILKIFLKVVSKFNSNQDNQQFFYEMKVFDTLVELVEEYYEDSDILPQLKGAIQSFTSSIPLSLLEKLSKKSMKNIENNKKSRVLLS